jgi:hypothetical protein
MAGHEKEDWVAVLQKAPTYVMLSADFDERPPSRLRYPGEATRLVKERYDVRSVWLDDTTNQESGYFTFLQLKEHLREHTRQSAEPGSDRTVALGDLKGAD